VVREDYGTVSNRYGRPLIVGTDRWGLTNWFTAEAHGAIHESIPKPTADRQALLQVQFRAGSARIRSCSWESTPTLSLLRSRSEGVSRQYPRVPEAAECL
jgi:hypothetical protein